MNHLVLHIDKKWSVLSSDVGECYDCVLPTNISIMRNGERLINGPPLDNLHCALIVQLYAARKALAKVSDVVTSLDIPS